MKEKLLVGGLWAIFVYCVACYVVPELRLWVAYSATKERVVRWHEEREIKRVWGDVRFAPILAQVGSQGQQGSYGNSNILNGGLGQGSYNTNGFGNQGTYNLLPGGASGPGNTIPPTNIFLMTAGHMSLNGTPTPENPWYDVNSNQFYESYLDNGGTYTIRLGRATNGDPGNTPTWNTYGAFGIVTNASPNGAPHVYAHTNGYYYCFWGMDDGNIYVASNNVLTNLFANTNSLSLLAGQVGAARIVLAHGTGFETSRILEPFVWYETNGGPFNGLFCMLYMGATNSVQEQVFMATNSLIDGQYTRVKTAPMIPWGGVGSIDAWTVADPFEWFWNGTWYVFYSFNKQNGDPWGTTFAYTTDWNTITKGWIVLNTNATDGSEFRGAIITNGNYYEWVHAGDSFYGQVATSPRVIINPNPHPILFSQTAWNNSTLLTFNTDSNATCTVLMGTSPGVYSAAYSNSDLAVGAPTNAHSFQLTNTTQGSTYYVGIFSSNVEYQTSVYGYSNMTSSFVQQAAIVLTPTNVDVGISAAVWYEPSRTYTTNGGGTVATLSNLTSFGSVFDLTNRAAAIKFPVRYPAFVNGLDTLTFTNGCFLENTAFTNGASGEVFLVASISNTTATSFMFDSDNASFRQALFDSGPNTLTCFDGGSETLASTVYNKLTVFDLIINGVGGLDYGFTNGVAFGFPTGSGQTCSGLRLALHEAGIDPANMNLLSFWWFTNQNLGVRTSQYASTARSNSWFYATNTFKLSVP